MDTTYDGLLNRRVTLEQPKKGFRVAMDTVFLAAAVPAQAGQRVLELGCGVGGVLLCLATRVPDLSILGIEIQPDLAALCARNIERNGFEKKIRVEVGDVTRLACAGRPPPIELFDHILMNPPYHDEKTHTSSAHPVKRTANTEKDGDLDAWLQTAAHALKPEGMLTLIHRADRHDAIHEALHTAGLAVQDSLALLPHAHEPAKRLILRARKTSPLPDMKRDGYTSLIVLHHADGRWTDEAEAVLRHGESL